MSIWLHKFRRRFHALFQREKLDARMDDEMRSHIEMQTQENIESGMLPEEARFAALREFGWVESFRDQCRDQRGVGWIENLGQDIGYGARQLRKNPGFTAAAALSLGLGIGICTVMFSVIHAALLRPLSFGTPDRLIWIENLGFNGLSERTTRMDTFMEWQLQQQSFDGLAGYFPLFDNYPYTMTGRGDALRLRGVPVTQNFLEVLGIKPALGRNFAADECVPKGRRAVILTHTFWRQQFGGDTNILGRSINLRGNPTEIVGVLPQSFDFESAFSPGTAVELLVPLPITPDLAGMGNMLFAIGRLRPGGTLQAARAEFDVINQKLVKAHPELDRFGARLVALDDSIRSRFRQPLLILFWATVCVLLIACANISNLQLTRLNVRRQELAVRAALGATQWRLIRQMLTESLLLACGGCGLGLPLAFIATAGIASALPWEIPLLRSANVDATALGFAVIIAGLASLVTGTLPALQLVRGNTRSSLNSANERNSGSATTSRIRNMLVVVEIAAACVLLIGAGLLIQSFGKLLDVNLGFQPRHAAAWRVDPPRSLTAPSMKTRYYDQLVQKVAAIPGVESVGLSDALPLRRGRSWGAGAKGISYLKGQMPTVFPRLVDHRYLQTMRVPLLAGRHLSALDTREAPRVAVINETMARRLWPDRDPIGQVITGINPGDYSVVGVVGDVRNGSLEEPPSPELYLDFRQSDDWSALDLVIRATRPIAGLAPDVRAVIKAFDPALPGAEFITLEQIVDRSVAPRKLITRLLEAFSLLALALSVLGLYGVIAYSVEQRTREIGIRMAVGAQRRDVVHLIVGEGFKLASMGVSLGVAVAFISTRMLNSLLFGVTATDPFIFGTNAAILVAVALLAAAIPALRAAQVNPVATLRGG